MARFCGEEGRPSIMRMRVAHRLVAHRLGGARAHLDVFVVRLRQAVARDGERRNHRERKVQGRAGEAADQVDGRNQHRERGRVDVRPQPDPECCRGREGVAHPLCGLNRLSADAGHGQVVLAPQNRPDPILLGVEVGLRKTTRRLRAVLQGRPNASGRQAPPSGRPPHPSRTCGSS